MGMKQQYPQYGLNQMPPEEEEEEEGSIVLEEEIDENFKPTQKGITSTLID
jgi:hypothetical protein